MERLTIAGNRLYVATDFPPRLYILDITMPLTPVVRGHANLPKDVENHAINGVEVQGALAYVLTDARTAASGTLQVVDIRDPANARVIGTSAPLPNRPRGYCRGWRLCVCASGYGGSPGLRHQ